MKLYEERPRQRPDDYFADWKQREAGLIGPEAEAKHKAAVEKWKAAAEKAKSEDKEAIIASVAASYPHAYSTPVEQTKAARSPACGVVRLSLLALKHFVILNGTK